PHYRLPGRGRRPSLTCCRRRSSCCGGRRRGASSAPAVRRPRGARTSRAPAGLCAAHAFGGDAFLIAAAPVRVERVSRKASFGTPFGEIAAYICVERV